MDSPLKESGIIDARGAERRRGWFELINTVMAETVYKTLEKRHAAAFRRMMHEIAASAIASAARADELEARLTALEAAVPKPRHRVPAPLRRSA